MSNNSDSRPIFINGRFLTQRTTGVQRFAREFICSLDEQLRQGTIHAKNEILLLSPKTEADIPQLTRITYKQVGHLKGHTWEQLELPFFSRSGLLFNPCGPAPVFHPLQVTTLHDASVIIAPTGYSRKYRLWQSLLLYRSAKYARKIITVSEFSKEELTRLCHIPKEKINVIYQSGNHILRNKPDPSILERHNLSQSSPYLLCVGSQQPNKNFSVLQQASKLLPDQSIKIVVVGSANTNVFRCARESDSNMIFTGYIKDNELRALYERAFCFIFPSLYEGFGIPPLEAMSCGCPVIASTAASIPEVCKDAAIYFDPRSPEALAEKITHLLEDPEKRAHHVRSAILLARKYDWDEMTRDLWQHIEQVAMTLDSSPKSKLFSTKTYEPK